MITEELYQKYLALLLDGNRCECVRIVQQLLDRDIEIKTLYADLMKTSTRTEDLVARFGGEEFIILLPLTEIGEAHAYAERIRRTLPAKDLLQNGLPVFASFGVSQLLPDETSADLIKRADIALYRAKNSGRNRTVTATGNDGHPSGTQLSGRPRQP